jgi:hypothetical protein
MGDLGNLCTGIGAQISKISDGCDRMPVSAWFVARRGFVVPLF